MRRERHADAAVDRARQRAHRRAQREALSIEMQDLHHEQQRQSKRRPPRSATGGRTRSLRPSSGAERGITRCGADGPCRRGEWRLRLDEIGRF